MRNNVSSPGKPPIKLISTFTKDVLIDESGAVLSAQNGGPAYFLSRALRDANVPFDCISGDQLTVEMLITPEGEFGRIPTPPTAKPLPDDLPDWTIVSTVLDEWDILSANRLPKCLCIDLQGFVRDGSRFGKKKPWDDIRLIANSIYCLKGTEEEVNLIPKGVLEDQKHRLLVITKGAGGVDLYCNDKHTYLAARPVENLRDTIGAGDTFFGYLVAELYKGAKPERAAQIAVDATALFLINKE